MKKTVSAIILVVLVLFLVKNCAVWKYEATVNGHNAPITVRVSMSGGRIRNVEVRKTPRPPVSGKKQLR